MQSSMNPANGSLSSSSALSSARIRSSIVLASTRIACRSVEGMIARYCAGAVVGRAATYGRGQVSDRRLRTPIEAKRRGSSFTRATRWPDQYGPEQCGELARYGTTPTLRLDAAPRPQVPNLSAGRDMELVGISISRIALVIATAAFAFAQPSWSFTSPQPPRRAVRSQASGTTDLRGEGRRRIGC